MKKVNLLGINVSVGGYISFLDELVQLAIKGESSYVCVANVHMLVEAYNSPEFCEVVNQAKVCTPDGMPLVWALKILNNIRQDRVCGMDILPDLLSRMENKALPVFIYGGSSEMLNVSTGYIAKQYPALPVAGTHSPPFRMLTESEESADIDMINSSGAKILFVCLGCPKQEKWMASMKGRISMPMIGIGGALPVMVGLQSRAPLWAQEAGLEWAYRFAQEPKRLFKRYAVTNTTFLFLLAKAYLKNLVRKEDAVLNLSKQ